MKNPIDYKKFLTNSSEGLSDGLNYQTSTSPFVYWALFVIVYFVGGVLVSHCFFKPL